MAKKSALRLLFFLTVLAALIFIVSGYLMSDAFFFKRLVYRNHITSPEEAFAFVIGNTGAASPETLRLHNITALEYSPREMLTEQKYLYCDQGAILMTTIVRELGYETRLTHWNGDDGVGHHVTLEVKQGGGWKSYDTLYRRQGETYEQIRARLDYDAHPVYREYVGSRWFTRNNYYLKRLSLWLKGVKKG
jgi:hypothetical protein